MAAASQSPPAAVPYGVITVDGIQYIERFQLFTTEHTITTPFEVQTNLRLTLPGMANFLLKGLTRDTTIPIVTGGPGRAKLERLMQQFGVAAPRDLPGSQDRRFRFRVVNSEGSTWFFSGGLGVFDDRVIDTMCFGDGQFPYMLVPPVSIHATGSLIYEIEDLGLGFPTDPDYYPYTICIGWQGSYLLPVAQAASFQSLVYSVGPGS